MKTQLLQDIQDSGAGRVVPLSAPRGYVPPRPWNGAGRAEAGTGASAQPAQPPPDSPPPSPDPPRAAADDPPATAIPDWLAERLREDAAQAERAERRTGWQRRAVGTGIAAGVLALAAAAGLWLVQENRVDGALVVVANTTPTVATPAPDGANVDASADADAGASAHAAPLAGVGTPSILSEVPARAAAGDGAADAGDPAASTQPVLAPRPLAPSKLAPATTAPPTLRMPTIASPTIAPPTIAPSTPSRAPTPPQRATTHAPGAAAAASRQHREETLMQCRAHGYDERQCAARACTMTRYGFACRG